MKKRDFALISFACIALAGCPRPPPLPQSQQAPNSALELSTYISGLPELPYRSDTGTGSAVILSSGIPAVSVADPNPNSLFPGSVVQGRREFAEDGKLSNYFLSPGAGTVTIIDVHFADATASAQRSVTSATLGNITDAISKITHQAFQPDQTGIAYSDIDAVFSSHQARQALSGSFSGYGVDANAFFSHADDKSENHIVFYFTQSYYTASFSPDSSSRPGPAAFFADGTSMADAKSARMDSSNPPLLVSSVTYGRRLYVMLSSQNSTSEMTASAKAAIHSLLGAEGGINASAVSDDILGSSHMQVLAIGGRASATDPILASFSGADIAKALTAYIHNGLDYSASGGAQDAGMPISYTLNYLQDLSQAKLDSSSHYEPYSASGPLVTDIDVTLIIGSDDKEREDGITLSITGPHGLVAISYWVPAHTSDQGLYWDKGTAHTTSLHLSTPILASHLAEYTFDIHSEGPDSWRGNVQLFARGNMLDSNNPPNRVQFGARNPIPVLSMMDNMLFLDQNQYGHSARFQNPVL